MWMDECIGQGTDAEREKSMDIGTEEGGVKRGYKHVRKYVFGLRANEWTHTQPPTIISC